MSEDLLSRLGLSVPVVQAPMAGGATPPAFIAECLRLGLLGSLGAAYMKPDTIAAQAAEIRARASGPLNINLFLPCAVPPAPGVVEAMLDFMAPLHAEAGLAPPHVPDPPHPDFAGQMEALRAARPEMASFVFGCPDAGLVAALKAEGIIVVGAATHLAEAEAVAAAGVDAVVAQGAEAGGHRATFIGSFEAGQVPTLDLVARIAGRLDIPVIAAGGLMDGVDVRAALDAGAAMVQIGTALLRTPECGLPAAHRDALGAGAGATTALIREWSGRAARGLPNRFTRAVEDAGLAVPPFPVQNAITQALRGKGRAVGDPDRLALWCGTGYSRAKAVPLADVVAEMLFEAGLTSPNH
ncbi:nitronate monooxygenase [Zavarzinia compransoris]|uniref:NAD(P)H-dependent flavin oxidoreductase n=1 Tax=Zavarzinia marina TaxID=2911065 RepID=UPI001F26AD2B|nr:nitronate monooxygenase [Zavarzinia marina]MCF4166218.1 nitronate monooxygenase [Zavarzinia marina]